jgi:transposase
VGQDWSGVLVHDGWSPYDKFTQADHQQCLAHLVRRANGLIEQARGRALVFPRAIKSLLLESLSVRDRAGSGTISWRGAAIVAGRLTSQMQRLTETIKSNPQQERFAKFLYNHLGSIFTFLRIPGTDATNWRGEQAIRPAVVNRKVWGGNRTWAGAIAQQNIASVIHTCTQRCADAFSFIKQSLCRPTPLPLAPG